jgi:hypothetical protein
MTRSPRRMRALVAFGQEIADHVESQLRGESFDQVFVLISAAAHIGAQTIKPDANYEESARTVKDIYRELLEQYHTVLKQKGGPDIPIIQ